VSAAPPPHTEVVASEAREAAVTADRTSRRAILGAFLITRTAGNAFVRFPYVYSTAIAAGLDIRLAAFTAVLGVRELVGLATPALGRLADRGHLARLVGIGAVLAGLACALAPFGSPWTFAVIFAFGGFAKLGIDLAQNSWISHQFVGARRGQVVGVIETSWALAFILVVPLLGLGIERWGWQAAFLLCGPVLAVAGGTAGRMVARHEDRLALVTEQTPPSGPDAPHPHAPTPATRRRTLGVLTFVVMQPFAQMLVFAVAGDWFASGLGLSVGQISRVTIGLGLAELFGTTLTIALAKRVHPLAGGAAAMLFCALALAAIAVRPDAAATGLALLLLADVALEFAFVAVLPVIGDLQGAARGKAFGRAFALMTASRAVASVVAGAIYALGGMPAITVIAVAACVVAAVSSWLAR